MMDARQAALGAQLAGQAARVGAASAWGVPPAEPGALRDDWQQPAGVVGVLPGGRRDHRPGAGDRAATVRQGADLAEAFRASVRALAAAR